MIKPIGMNHVVAMENRMEHQSINGIRWRLPRKRSFKYPMQNSFTLIKMSGMKLRNAFIDYYGCDNNSGDMKRSAGFPLQFVALTFQ